MYIYKWSWPNINCFRFCCNFLDVFPLPPLSLLNHKEIENDRTRPESQLVSYYCRMYAVEQALKRRDTTPPVKFFVFHWNIFGIYWNLGMQIFYFLFLLTFWNMSLFAVFTVLLSPSFSLPLSRDSPWYVFF